MSNSISNFKNAFNGGTRKNRFEISGTFPGGSWNKYLVSAATLPQVSVLTNAYDYRGRKLLLPGDRIYGEQPGGTNWPVTILDDNSLNPTKHWLQFNNWSNSINNHTSNTGLQDIPSSYKADNWRIRQLNLNCSNVPLREVTLMGCWPMMIDKIDLNMSRVDEYVTFDVVFVYDYLTITQGI